MSNAAMHLHQASAVFKGIDVDDDYDVWWSELQVYFLLYKVPIDQRLIFAEVGIKGKARLIVDSHDSRNS